MYGSMTWCEIGRYLGGVLRLNEDTLATLASMDELADSPTEGTRSVPELITLR